MELSALLLKLLKDNNISGCLILVRDEGGDVAIAQAADNIHEIDVIESLAAVILEREIKKRNSSSRLGRHDRQDVPIHP